MKDNKVCIVCGKTYHYCNSCYEQAHLEPWHNLYHDENCREVFHIISNYYANKITKEEAKEKLNKCDLSQKDRFSSSIVKAMEEIYFEEKVEIPVMEIVSEEAARPKRGMRSRAPIIEEASGVFVE